MITSQWKNVDILFCNWERIGMRLSCFRCLFDTLDMIFTIIIKYIITYWVALFSNVVGELMKRYAPYQRFELFNYSIGFGLFLIVKILSVVCRRLGNLKTLIDWMTLTTFSTYAANWLANEGISELTDPLYHQVSQQSCWSISCILTIRISKDSNLKLVLFVFIQQ